MLDRTSINKIQYHNLSNMEYPIHIQIDPSGACNQRCIYCFYHGGYDDRQKVLRIEDIRKKSIKTEPLLNFLDDCRDIVRTITLVGGGEPLIHPDIELILKKIVGCGFKFGVITNFGMGLSDETIRLLQKADWIRVSLDAGTKITYNKLHRPYDKKAFDRVIYNIRILNHHPVIGLSYLIHKENIGDIWWFYQLALKLLSFNDYIQFKPVYDESQGFNYTEEEIKNIDGQINEFKKDALHEDPCFEIVGGLKDRIDTLRWKPEENCPCQISKYRIQLGSDGFLYPCCMFKYSKEYRYGSIYDECYDGNKFKAIMDSHKRAMVDIKLKIKQCPPCWDKPIQSKIVEGKLRMIDRKGDEVDLDFV